MPDVIHLAQAPKTSKPFTTWRYKIRKAKWGDFGSLFMRLLEDSNRSSNQDKESMWDKVNRVLTNGHHEDTSIRCPTISHTLQASADLLAYTFYLTDHPCHRQISKWALSFSPDKNLPEDDPPGNGVENTRRRHPVPLDCLFATLGKWCL